ncbi:DoxX family protein [Thalassospira sp.]|uniref:DoxX family protein n=1 Tax=Thalassospira sp. TaxID=1912094 RepID=UPI000C40E116|nr:DoxX family protein [Thalassospira sp.]MBC05737.1 DoxX family protein [Thalassospira sp.]|tara:strand:- start:624 stop:971 length:348 start_codon:yes stop_codon:yes gene_type:complete
MKKLNWLTIYALILAVFFVIGGTMNLLASDATQADYARWGYPTWFPYLTGTLEWAAAILLVFRATRLVGAALAGSVMIAAAGTLILNCEYAHSIAPITVLILVAAYAITHAKHGR